MPIERPIAQHQDQCGVQSNATLMCAESRIYEMFALLNNNGPAVSGQKVKTKPQ